MRIHFILAFILIISITSCKSSFVGTVVFTTTIKANSPEYSQLQKEYTERYGDTLELVYCKNGDMYRYHKNSSPEVGFNYQWYNADKGEIYFVYLNGVIDTFQVADNTVRKIFVSSSSNETIAGEDCKCYTIHGYSNGHNTDLNICYPANRKKYWLNHRLYKSYEDFFLHDFYKKSKVPYLKYYMDFSSITIEYDGVEIIFKEDEVENVIK